MMNHMIYMIIWKKMVLKKINLDISKEELSKLKKWKEYTLDEVEKSLKVQWFIEDLFWVKIVDTDFLLNLYKLIFSNVQNNLKKASR